MVTDPTDTELNDLREQAEAAEASLNNVKSDRDTIVTLYGESPDLDPEDEFKFWVESFVIPTGGDYEVCGVLATRDTSYDDYDFFIWYLVGPCTD